MSGSAAPAGPRRFIKPGTVVMCLRGRQAGKKAVILKTHESGIGGKKFPCATVVGIQRPPRQVKRGMSQSVIKKKQKVGVFFKHVNYSHFMPTRYTFTNAMQMVNVSEVEELLKKDVAKTEKKAKKREVGKAFQEHVLKSAGTTEKAAGAKWFLTKLKF
ncbi:large ribosomal subunit protein eL27-like [Symsagittifera roscoffensis]|uniref:large ribosomal subunit protein eL27-like n=1 Tax=Symsagittifera roscoffensis TaxID=84072 RepID=UPI00307C983C